MFATEDEDALIRRNRMMHLRTRVTCHRRTLARTLQARTVIATTTYGRQSRNNRQYTNYRQMNVGIAKERRAPARRTRIIGEDGNYNTCGKCGQLGELLLECDGCPESFHLECIGLEIVPEGDWHCHVCSSGASAR